MGDWWEWGCDPRIIALDAALASAGLAYDFPGDSLYAIRSVAFRLTTAAGGGNRQVTVALEDALGVPVYAIAAPVVQAGGLAVTYAFAPESQPFGTAALGRVGGPFAGGLLPQNMTVKVAVAANQAADHIDQARLLVHRLERP